MEHNYPNIPNHQNDVAEYNLRTAEAEHDAKMEQQAPSTDRRSHVSDVQKGQENLGVDVYHFHSSDCQAF